MSSLTDGVSQGFEQESAAAAEVPSPVNGDGARHQSWCHATVPDGAAQCPRCGAWQPGNQAALTTGVYAQEPPPEVRAHVDMFTAGIVADLGGESELSTLEQGRIRRLGGLEGTLLLIEADIARRGLLTPAGNVRRVYADYLDGNRTWDRVASRLPAGRRPRRVPTLSEVMGNGE